MSESASTRTKTLTDTDDTLSTETPLQYDRWTNNITYRQLVVSTCIGIFQLWWHPYIQDFRRLVPFLLLHNVFSVLVAYPLFYMELALGIITKKGVVKCWDMAPLIRGLGVSMVITSMFSALAASAAGAWSLALSVHSWHTFLPWLHCAATAAPPCAARQRPITPGSETPTQSFFFNFVLNLKRDGLSDGLGSIVWELTTYHIICWTFIYLILIKKIYSYSKLILFKDLLTFFVLVSCAVGVSRLDGATRMFKECDWGVLFQEFKIWREALEYSLVEMSVGQGTIIMLGSYCPKENHKLGTTALLALGISKVVCMMSAFILGGTHGALANDYDNDTNIWKGLSSTMVLWSDFVARVPGSQFWSALIFFTLFLLALSTTAVLIQTILSAFSGRSLRKISWAILIVICLLACIIGVMTLCTQGGLYLTNFLISWPASKPRALIAMIMSFVITYIYGQTMFCEEVYFAATEYPNLFLRICWALSPPFMLCFIASGFDIWSAPDALAGWLFVVFAALPIPIIMFFYAIFKFRVRNIVGEEK